MLHISFDCTINKIKSNKLDLVSENCCSVDRLFAPRGAHHFAAKRKLWVNHKSRVYYYTCISHRVVRNVWNRSHKILFELYSLIKRAHCFVDCRHCRPIQIYIYLFSLLRHFYRNRIKTKGSTRPSAAFFSAFLCSYSYSFSSER